MHHEIIKSVFWQTNFFFIEPEMSSIKKNEKLQEKSLDIYEVLQYKVSCSIYIYSFIVFRTCLIIFWGANSAVEFAM